MRQTRKPRPPGGHGSALVLLVACVFGSACDAGPESSPDREPVAYTTTDSAGVRLAVSSVTEPLPATGWTIDPVPEVVYGESGESVDWVWIRAATLLDDGRVAALDGGANELFVFEATGVPSVRAGGTGDGPGEFQGPAGLVSLGGDTLLVYDSDHHRFSLFDADGRLLGDRRLEIPDGGEDAPRLTIYAAAAAIADTVVLIGEGFGFRSTSTGDFVWENPTLLYDADGTYVGTTAEPMRMWMYGSSEGPQARLFGGTQEVEAKGRQVYVGDREAYEVRVYDAGQGLTRILRLQRPRRPVTDEMVDRYTQWFLGEVDADGRDRWAERITEAPVADSMAWIGDLEVDVLGNVWVSELRVTGDDPDVTSVFSADGRWLGTIEMPPNFTALEIGRDYVLGAQLDELHIPSLVRLGLERGDARMEASGER